MAYPDDLLADDERVVRHLHPHWITLAVPVLVFVVTMGTGSFLASYIAHTGTSVPVVPLRLVILAVALAVLVYYALVPLLTWRSTHYVITTRRVLIRTGVLSHRGRDIPLQRITDVVFRQSFADRLIGAGTLGIESAGEQGLERLDDIPHADRVQQLLNRLVDRDDARRRSARGDWPSRAASSGGRRP